MECFCDCPTGGDDAWLVIISFFIGCVFATLLWRGVPWIFKNL